MAFTTFSGPVRSVAGFAEPITYIFATDVVGGAVNIPAGGNIVILSAADGGPASTCTLVLPQVVSGEFSLASGQNPPADVRYAGIKGSILNYDASITHVLGGFGTNDSTSTAGQKVNGSTAGVVIPAGYGVQFGGNGNQNAPWAATNSVLSTANTF
jgi:hypothetical protein